MSGYSFDRVLSSKSTDRELFLFDALDVKNFEIYKNRLKIHIFWNLTSKACTPLASTPLIVCNMSFSFCNYAGNKFVSGEWHVQNTDIYLVFLNLILLQMLVKENDIIIVQGIESYL